MFQIGVIMLIAFMGAAIASRFRLSVIIGYILAGIFIGPHVQLAIGGLSYQGIITDSAFIQDLSRIGLILLLFFVGLQFSIEKLKKTKEAAVVLAVVNLGVGMFCGFVLGTYLGWPFIDTIFMAGVVSMSSSAITAKSLIELRRLGNNETEFLLGMVILESFMAMFLLTLVTWLVRSMFVTAPVLTAPLAYVGGSGGRAGTAVGSGMLGRNEEASLDGCVGTRAIQSNPALPKEYAGTLLTPFAGIVCIIMSSLTPTMMNRSERIAGWFSRHLPTYITFGGGLVQRTLRTFVLPASLALFRRSRSVVLRLLA